MEAGSASVRCQLCHCLSPSSAVVGALARPMYAHRLDEGTGGLLVVAKTRQALAELSAAFRERRVGLGSGLGPARACVCLCAEWVQGRVEWVGVCDGLAGWVGWRRVGGGVQWVPGRCSRRAGWV